MALIRGSLCPAVDYCRLMMMIGAASFSYVCFLHKLDFQYLKQTYFSLYRCNIPLVTSTKGFPQKKPMVSLSSDVLLRGGDLLELDGRTPSTGSPVRTLA